MKNEREPAHGRDTDRIVGLVGFGIALRKWRTGKFTQQELADECGLTVATISRIERGAVTGVHPKNLRVIQEKLGVDKEVFFSTYQASAELKGKTLA